MSHAKAQEEGSKDDHHTRDSIRGQIQLHIPEKLLCHLEDVKQLVQVLVHQQHGLLSLRRRMVYDSESRYTPAQGQAAHACHDNFG